MKNFIYNRSAVVFDLDNTLYNETDYFTIIFDEFCKRKGISSKNSLIELYREIRPYSKDIIGDLLNGVGIYSQENKDYLFNLYTSVNVKEGALQVDKAALNFIVKLRQKNVKVGLLTNGLIKAQQNKIRILDIESYFDKIVFAREFGREFEKPHHLPFEAITERLNEEFASVVFIGDNPETDFSVPHSRGALTIRRRFSINSNRNSLSDVDFEFYSWNDLIEKL